MCDGAVRGEVVGGGGGGEGICTEQAEVKGILGEGVGLWRHPVAWHDGELRGLIMLQGIHSA